MVKFKLNEGDLIWYKGSDHVFHTEGLYYFVRFEEPFDAADNQNLIRLIRYEGQEFISFDNNFTRIQSSNYFRQHIIIAKANNIRKLTKTELILYGK